MRPIPFSRFVDKDYYRSGRMHMLYNSFGLSVCCVVPGKRGRTASPHPGKTGWGIFCCLRGLCLGIRCADREFHYNFHSSFANLKLEYGSLLEILFYKMTLKMFVYLIEIKENRQK